MDTTAANILIQLNQKFYGAFAPQFSETRQRLQPGVKSLLEQIPTDESVIDLGCGNGELARVLAEKNHQGNYVGLDFSPELLDEARKSIPMDFPAALIEADLTTPDWHVSLPTNQFDWALAFAVLHHIPSRNLRLQILKQTRSLLHPQGTLMLSVWQFLNSKRLRERIQPWDSIGLSPEDVDPGDYLLDWRRGGRSLRYVHHFTRQELRGMAELTGFEIRFDFFSDGKNNQLGYYQIWNKTENKNSNA